MRLGKAILLSPRSGFMGFEVIIPTAGWVGAVAGRQLPVPRAMALGRVGWRIVGDQRANHLRFACTFQANGEVGFVLR